MDIGSIRGLGTLILFVAFVRLVIWPYSNKRKKSFDEAANLPFADETVAEEEEREREKNQHTSEEQASRSNKQ